MVTSPSLSFPPETQINPTIIWFTYLQSYLGTESDTTDALPRHIRLPVCLPITDPHSRAAKKNTCQEMRSYRKILHISYKDHATNEEVCAKIQQAI